VGGQRIGLMQFRHFGGDGKTLIGWKSSSCWLNSTS
jgi:hypothetical protein